MHDAKTQTTSGLSDSERALFSRSVRDFLGNIWPAAQAVENCAAVILDLNFAPVELITQLKTGEATRSVPLIGYVSHVQADLIRQAKESGCDQVLARSAFVAHLGSMMETFARS